MLRIGLTGGTGSGKSTVAARLAEHGAVVVDADVLAREVVAHGTEGLTAVVAQFGPEVLTADGDLDRAALATVVFADPAGRRALEAITHPLIAARTAELVAAAPDDAILVHDVPLLVEKGMGPGYHLVVVVDAPVPERVRRLVGRGLDEADARRRIAAQADDRARRAAADVWLDNPGTQQELSEAVDRVWERLTRFRDNLVAGHHEPPAARARLVPPDPTWPVQAERLLARIHTALGELTARLVRPGEHIGSTAVNGLPAKDVIDLQLVVGSLEDADALRERLGAAGFARLPEDWFDEEPRGEALKRLHGSCDPGRRVNLHVRPDGWTAAHQSLFRDWLRANPAERDAYADVKAAARSETTTRAYTDRKGPWIRAAYGRAEVWGDRTGWQPINPL